MFLALLIFAVLFLAWWNGANDNFKGVATLYGSGTLNYRAAITLATIATTAGSLTAIFVAQGLVDAFSGKGLVPDDTAGGIEFLIAVGFGAATTVLIATRLGLPISTTHSLVGGLVGAGVMAVGSAVDFATLGLVFFVPLLFSPLFAAALAVGMYAVANRTGRRFNFKKDTCLCLGEPRQVITALHPVSATRHGYGSLLSAAGAPSAAGALSPAAGVPALVFKIDAPASCEQFYSSRVAGISVQKLVDLAHTASAAVVSFARGLNDAPKIAGLLVAARGIETHWGLVAIAIAIALGGLLNARRVAETISHKITTLSHGQGLVANLVTGFVVIVASRFGLPVSTTHVSVGAIFGIGAISGTRNTRVIREILLSWLATLPLAMGLSAFFYWLIG